MITSTVIFQPLFFFKHVVFGFAVEIGVFSVLNSWVFPKLFPLKSDKLSGVFLKKATTTTKLVNVCFVFLFPDLLLFRVCCVRLDVYINEFLWKLEFFKVSEHSFVGSQW